MPRLRRWFCAMLGSVIVLCAFAETGNAALSATSSFRIPSNAQQKKSTTASLPKNLRGRHKVFFAIMIDKQGVHPLNGDFQDHASVTIGGKVAIVTPAGQRIPSEKILKTYLGRNGTYFSTLERLNTLLIQPKKARFLDLLKGESSEYFANRVFRKCTASQIRSINVFWIAYHFKNPVEIVFFVEK
jgi:hypothetical protein